MGPAPLSREILPVAHKRRRQLTIEEAKRGTKGAAIIKTLAIMLCYDISPFCYSASAESAIFICHLVYIIALDNHFHFLSL